ncbi:MAG TPA: phosphate-starvation-inducible PsiE family protein [Ktedonobacterales bacterium]|nr:phosphate-starvation-inducible PsiE family protein [Ktedonobacterales bacterium]
MSEHETVQETTTATAAYPTNHASSAASPGHGAPSHIQESVAARWLEKGDTFIYGLVGACFFLGALFTLGYAFYNFFNQLTTNPAVVNGQKMSNTAPANIAQAIINLVSDLLLVLIIMEVLSTVLHYLRARATSLTPFLFIGMISATRGVLAIGARLSVTQVSGDEFRNAMVELGVNAAVILALGITLRILSKHVTSDVE